MKVEIIEESGFLEINKEAIENLNGNWYYKL